MRLYENIEEGGQFFEKFGGGFLSKADKRCGGQ
jgi:hypothetical protein